MNGEKVYKITINGIEQSTKEMDALLNQLNQLEQRIGTLGKSGSGSGVSGGLKEASKATDELTKKQEKLNQTIRGEKDEVLELNRLLKDATKERQAELASGRLSANEYMNTMNGLKQKLADIKTVMGGMEIGSKEFNELSNAAGELNSKLKEIETSYGQFGRNVGNYASAAEGFKNITVSVGGANREFSSVRDAVRQLEQEIKALSIAGKEDTQEFKDLTDAYDKFNKAVQRADSAVNDLKASSQGMDKLLDMGQSIGAIGQVTQGFSAFFGTDSDIQRSIQSLMGLMSAMQGIEKLQKQMITGEGLGTFFKKSSDGIDQFVDKLLGIKPAADTVKTANDALSVSAEEVADAEGTVAAAEGAVTTGGIAAAASTNALSTAQKAAAVSAKALKVALKAIGIGILIEGLSEVKSLIDPITKDLFNFIRTAIGVKDIVPAWREADERFTSVIDEGNDMLSKRIDYIHTLKSLGSITDSEAAEMELEVRINDAKEAMEGLKNAVKDTDFGDELNDNWVYPTEEAAERLKKAFDSNGKDVRDWSDRVSDAWKKVPGQTDSISEDAQYVLAQFTKRYERAVNLMEVDSEKGRKAIMELYKEANNDQLLSSLLNHPEQWIDDDGAIANINRIRNAINGLAKDAKNINPIGTIERIINGTKTESERILEDIKKVKEEMEGLKKSVTPRNMERLASGETALKVLEEEYRKSLNTATSGNKKLTESTRDLYRLRVSAMKEGLTKTLAQLSIERDEMLARYKGNREMILEINKTYDEKEYEEKKKWYDKLNELQLDAANEELRIAKERLDKEEEAIRNKLDGMRMNLGEYLDSGGNAIIKENSRQLTTSNYGLTVGTEESTFEYRKKALNEYLEEKLKLEKGHLLHRFEEEKNIIDKERDYRLGEEEIVWKKKEDELDQYVKDAEEQYGIESSAYTNAVDTREKEYLNHLSRIAEAKETHDQKMIELETKKNADIQNLYNESYNVLLQEYRDFLSYISDLQSQAPIFNKFGIVDINATKKNYNEVKLHIKSLFEEIEKRKNDAEITFEGGLIDQEVFDATTKELNRLKAQVKSAMMKVEEDSKDLVGEFIASINQYIQVAGQSIQQLLSMFWNMNDANHQAFMEQLQNEIEAYEEKQSKLEEITRQHTENINSIEDKLATARGDRRERLIDQLNAEMAAKRKSLAEEKKNQLELDRLRKKADEEDLKQRQLQKKRDKTSAIISAALATANGYATKPFMPTGLIMGSIAAALGAVQVAVISNTKYADGGLIQGKSHAQGGVPILGGRAEVEGGEFITNKRTTAQNIDVLSFINSRKRRLDIGDFIEFYSAPVKRNIKNVTNKFAAGGVIPSLNTDIDVTDRLAASFEAYANRPVYVSVQEITDKQADVKNVQVLAGL